MKIKIIILFLVFLFYAVTLNAQNHIRIDTISVSYFNGITKKKEIIDIYQITNDSDEDYLTWVSLAPINNRTNTKLIRDYFIKIKGDYNLIGMMNDNLLTLDSLCEIGYTFMKNISPSETFSYFVAKNRIESRFYRERIVIIKKKEIERYLKMRIDNKYLYQFSDIFLIEK
jgi:hypothetical protein